jgi:hypothetical protein
MLTSLKDFNDHKESIRGDLVERKKLTKEELITIQVEQLIYLKFWESNFIIRLLYQLSRLANGEDYDWDFDTIKKSRKRILVESVRNKIEPLLKPFAELFDCCYNSQIRNAIAHSLFYTIDDTIILTNYKHNPGDTISSITFEEWRPYIHKTLVIFDEFIRVRQIIDKFYQNRASSTNNKLEFRLKTKSHNELRTIDYSPNELNKWGNIQPLR